MFGNIWANWTTWTQHTFSWKNYCVCALSWHTLFVYSSPAGSNWSEHLLFSAPPCWSFPLYAVNNVSCQLFVVVVQQACGCTGSEEPQKRWSLVSIIKMFSSHCWLNPKIQPSAELPAFPQPLLRWSRAPLPFKQPGSWSRSRRCAAFSHANVCK